MSAARFVSFVKANLVGKRVHSAFVTDAGWPRIVFSDGSVCEVGADATGRAPDEAGRAVFKEIKAWPTISTAESQPVPVEGK